MTWSAAVPHIDPDVRRRLLAPPVGRRRLVIDTDTANEIDDQFALCWALQSPDLLDVQAVLVEPYSFAHLRPGLLAASEALRHDDTEVGLVDSFTGWAARLAAAGIDARDIPFPGPRAGMLESYDEAVRVFRKVGVPSEGRVFHGAERYMSSVSEPVDSPAVDRLIELALEPADGPLYVAAIGCLTNVASAIVREPRIIDDIVVMWTAGYPSWSPRSNAGSLNLEQDVAAAHVVFDSGVPLMYFPGFYMGAQLRLSLPEMETWVRGRGAIGDYLYHLYTNNPLHAQRGIFDHYGRTWVMWDMIVIAWLLEPAWVPTDLVATPTYDDDLVWVPSEGSERVMREAHGIDRDAIFRDFFTKLEAATR